MSPTDGAVSSSIDADLAAVRTFNRRLKIACDELHDDPFDVQARAALVQLIEQESGQADAALARISGE
jgi:hypothetical protein